MSWKITKFTQLVAVGKVDDDLKAAIIFLTCAKINCDHHSVYYL